MYVHTDVDVRFVLRVRSYFLSPTGCRVWTGATDRCGYGVVQFRQTNTKAHRAAWELANGPIPEGMSCLHKCDRPACIEPDHLFLGTALDNVTDKIQKGRHPHGEKHPNAKLTDDKARAILADTRSQRLIALDYGISKPIVRLIKKRKLWKHI